MELKTINVDVAEWLRQRSAKPLTVQKGLRRFESSHRLNEMHVIDSNFLGPVAQVVRASDS